jgi:phosphate transport system substrate-binding protein
MRKTMALVLAALFIVSAGAQALAATTLLETGSTLLYPLMNLWVADYQKSNPNVQITTQGTGSGTGISQAISGVAQIGASDAYMADAQMKATPMLNIPLAISAQQVNYNVPGLNDVHLNLSGPVLAGIYNGDIKFWDDAKIKDINKPYASKLPHKEIVPIHRAEGSGDTFIFTQYLSKSTPSWANGPGYGTTISWPSVGNAVGATGNPGMVQTCQNTQYSVAYIGVAYIDQTKKAGLGYAQLENAAGKFVLPTKDAINAAAAATDKATPPDQRISLIFAPGEKSYPIINYEYAIVNPKQADPSKSGELKKFLNWALTEGQSDKYLGAVHFLPLPASIVKLSKEQVEKIQ